MPGREAITLGREVKRLVDAHLPAGNHEVVWRPADLPSGLYICRLQAAGSTAERALTLVN